MSSESFLKNLKVENILNRDGDILPYGYFNPATEGRLNWMCGRDSTNKITSVFCFEHADGHREKSCKYLDTEIEAKHMRDELIKDGWNKIVPPKIEFTMPDDDGNQKPLNRTQRRAIIREMSKK